MVVIRLARSGAKKKPYYYITVANKLAARDGKFLARVGYFNPVAKGKEKKLHIEMALVNEWLDKGAQVTDRVAKLLKTYSATEQTAAL